MKNDDDKNRKQSNKQSAKLKKMMNDLKKAPLSRPPTQNSIFNVIRESQPKKRKKYSAEIIHLNPNGNGLDYHSDLYYDVKDEAFEEGYDCAVNDLQQDLEKAQKEAEHLRSLIKSISMLVKMEV